MKKSEILLDKDAFIGTDGKLYETVVSYSKKLTELSYSIANAVMRGEIERPTVAVSVPRGGLLPTEYISRALDIKGQCVVGCAVSTYDNESKTGVVLRGQLPMSEEICDRWVIVAEDIADTGETLEEVKKILLERGAAGVISAAVYWKRQCKEPDFWVSDADPGQWIVFPSDFLEEFGLYFSKQMQLPIKQRDIVKG